MYYDIRNQEILDTCPLNGYLENGVLVQGLDIADSSTQKLCGILPIKSDTPRPENTYENVGLRSVTIEDDGVIVVRSWVENSIIVPDKISPRQIRLWLVEHGVSLLNVDAAIANINDDLLREKTKIEWEFSPYVERNHPMINVLGAALGLSEDNINQAFIEASKL